MIMMMMMMLMIWGMTRRYDISWQSGGRG